MQGHHFWSAFSSMCGLWHQLFSSSFLTYLPLCSPSPSSSVFQVISYPVSPFLTLVLSHDPSSLCQTCPYHPSLFSCIFLCISVTFILFWISSFLILSHLVTPCAHLNIFISAMSILLSCDFLIAHVSVPYVMAGLTTVLKSSFPSTLMIAFCCTELLTISSNLANWLGSWDLLQHQVHHPLPALTPSSLNFFTWFNSWSCSLMHPSPSLLYCRCFCFPSTDF